MARPTDGGPEQDWVPARLIPTAGIRGQEEQEKRATSAFLAVLPAVPDFGHAQLSGLGVPKGRISTFTVGARLRIASAIVARSAADEPDPETEFAR
jgi:hypothetical protein